MDIFSCTHGDFSNSLSVMESLGIQVFFAFDAHFSTFRTQRGQAFTNIKFLV